MPDGDALFELSVETSGPAPNAALRDRPQDSPDEELDQVAAWFARRPDAEQRFSDGLRQSIDEVLDGQRTGRFDVEDLEKTEKTYLGTKVEIVVRSAFEMSKGQLLDYQIEGIEVDAKYTTRFGGWMFPREAVGQLCLLLHADDRNSVFSAGLLRVDPSTLRGGANQDGKRSLISAHHDRIRWLYRNSPLTENLLLHLDPTVRDQIFRFVGSRDGQKRVNELFRLVHGRIVSRQTVLTVGKQDDPMKRARDARRPLGAEGIVILGHQNDHPRLAAQLGLPTPAKGQFVAARLTPATSDEAGPTVHLHDRLYTIAEPEQPIHPLNGLH